MRSCDASEVMQQGSRAGCNLPSAVAGIKLGAARALPSVLDRKLRPWRSTVPLFTDYQNDKLLQEQANHAYSAARLLMMGVLTEGVTAQKDSILRSGNL